jgi:hypothetical protein
MQTSYLIPETSPIVVLGDEPLAIDKTKYGALPWGIIETDEPRSDIGPAANDITTEIDTYMWVILQKLRNTDSAATVRARMSALATNLWAGLAEDKLNGTVNNMRQLAYNWQGSGRSWPVEVAQGVAIAAGFVGITFIFTESRR